MDSTGKMNRAEVLKVELDLHLDEHRELDATIAALHEKGGADTLTLKRLKKQKLALKDQIARIQDELTPDIIA